MVKELVYNQRMDFNEAMQAIGAQWSAMSEEQKSEFEVEDERDKWAKKKV